MLAKRRIVHLIGSLGSGGCEHMLLRTLPRLNDRDYEQVVVTMFRPGVLAEEFRRRGVRVVPLGGPGRIVPLVRSLQPALVVTYLFHADMLGRLVLQPRTDVPVVPFLRTTYNAWRYLPARLAEWLTRGLAAGYLANSEAVKRFYVRSFGIPAERISVIPNGLELAAFEQADPAAVRRELRLAPDAFVVTCVANLARTKGHRYLVEAFAAFAAGNPTARLLLAGTGSEEAALRDQVLRLGMDSQVHFLGRRNDIPSLLRASDVFVLPTAFEGMSNAVQEAMAAALPVITTDIPENRSLVSDHMTGFLVPVGSSEPIHALLALLCSLPALRHQLGVAARQSVRDRFSLTTVQGQWRAAFAAWAAA